MLRFLSVCLALVFAISVLATATTLAQEKTDAKPNPLDEPIGDAGVVPVGADGKPLNLDFETGTLEGLDRRGRRRSRASRSRATRHVPRPDDRTQRAPRASSGSAATRNSATSRTGTLTSRRVQGDAPVGAASSSAAARRTGTRVELVTADDDKVFYRRRGTNERTCGA